MATAIKRGTKEHRLACKNKRSPGQVEADAVYIADLYARGKSHREITEALNADRPYTLTRPIISGQIKGILEDWRLHTIQEIGIQRAEELIRLNKIEAEAWLAWERSKIESTQTVTEKSEGKNGRTLARVVRDGRDGDPRFLMIVGNCVTERCKLLGLYAAVKSELTGKDGIPLPPSHIIIAPVVKVVMEETKETRQLASEFHGRN